MKLMRKVCLNELRRIFALKPVFSVVILSLALYSVFYPQPYLAEALRNVPIAVVDKDGTSSSRLLAQRVDATPDLAVVMALPDLASAQREVYLRNIFGILVIPQNFERDLLHGRPSPIALYSDASYFMVNQRISTSVSAVARTFGAEVEAARLVAVGIDPVLAEAASDPMPLTAVPLFNPQGGYATYILPAAFVLLLQQTLLMGVGLLTTLPGRKIRASAWQTVAGRLAAYLCLEAIVLPLYLVALPYFYGLPRLGSAASILVIAVPFVLAVGAMGIVIARVLRTSLAVQLTTAAIGMPFMFLSGFSWPTEAIPQFINCAALLVPSTSAIDGIVRVSQLGASLNAVSRPFFTLCGLAIFYAGTAIMLEHSVQRLNIANKQS